MFKISILAFVVFLMVLNVFSVSELAIFSRARFLAISEVINFGVWIFMPDRKIIE